MKNINQHIDSLVRHVRFVQEACIFLGKLLIESGQPNFGRLLIAKGFEHDVSKFYGSEWDYLHQGQDVPEPKLKDAIHQHNSSNQHHPEFWSGVQHMPELAVAEMVCDWYARSQEFGSSLRDWVKNVAIAKYNIDIEGQHYKWIQKYLDLLLESDFKVLS